MKRFLILALILCLVPASAWAARAFVTNSQNISSSGLTAPSAGTISVWIRPNWNSGDSSVREFWTFGTTFEPSCQRFSDNKIYCGFVSPENRVIVSDTGVFTSGKWVNLVFTYSSAGETVYANAVSVGTHGAFTPNPTANYRIGQLTGSSQTVNAGMAEFAVWNRVLSANEITAVAQGSSPLEVSPTSLLVYTPLLGIGTAEPDWGPSHYAQTVNGSPAFQAHAPVQPYPQVRYGQ